MINESNETEKFTIEKLRTFKGLENINDDEANEILKTFDIFSAIIYDSFQEQILKKC